MAVKVGVQLLGVDALSILHVELDDLGTDVWAGEKRNSKGKRVLRTPPDFGIFTTVIRWPYVRCISTFSFSWPTTRITLTVGLGEIPSLNRPYDVDLLRKASTHALIRVCR